LEVHQRYRTPVFIAETGANAFERAEWIEYVAREVEHAVWAGADVCGVCLYPMITSPDWEDPTAFFDSGVLDVQLDAEGRQKRVLEKSVARALRSAQERLDPRNVPSDEPPIYDLASADVPVMIAQLVEEPRVRLETFSYELLVAGDALSIERYYFEPHARLHPHKHAVSEHVLTVVVGQAVVDPPARRRELAGAQRRLPRGFLTQATRR
jgi:hypothetical protein